MGARQFGARVKRLEDPALLTGRGRFVDDVKLPGTLEACFVRSPYAHARIRSIDVAPALALPGVHAVLTADDLPGPMARDPIPMILPVLGIAAFRTQLCLARDEVSYAGQTIALTVPVSSSSVIKPCAKRFGTYRPRAFSADSTTTRCSR